MNRIAIVDYGMCNLDSVARAVEECGAKPIITDDAAEIEAASRVILPGVGAFSEAMNHIRERHLDEILCEQVIVREKPFLGICLGMQLMATRGLENGVTTGLGWMPGDVERLVPTTEDHRIPHIGWDEVAHPGGSSLFAGIPSGKDFYFVHSYHLRCADEEHVIASTPYCGGFASAVQRAHLFGVQFHPEKSQKVGFQLLKNFLLL